MGWLDIADTALKATAAVAGPIISNVGAKRQAERAQAFSERMRNTSHQAEVEDLIAAGLNPVLSAGGSGAASPEGVFYQPENIFQDFPDVLSSAQKLKPDIEVKKASAQLSSAQKAKTDLEAQNVRETGNLIRAQAAREVSSADVNNATAAKIRAETPKREVEGRLWNYGKKILDRVETSARKAKTTIDRETTSKYYYDPDSKSWKLRPWNGIFRPSDKRLDFRR